MTENKPKRVKPLVKVPEPGPDTNVLVPGLLLNVTVPGTPPMKIGPNGRVHWRGKHGKAAAVAQVRGTACMATRTVVLDARLGRDDLPFPADAWIGLTFTIAWEKGRKRVEDDNLVGLTKALRDGFADGLGRSDATMRTVKVEQVRDADGIGWVQIHAEVIGKTAAKADHNVAA